MELCADQKYFGAPLVADLSLGCFVRLLVRFHKILHSMVDVTQTAPNLLFAHAILLGSKGSGYAQE